MEENSEEEEEIVGESIIGNGEAWCECMKKKGGN